MSYCQNIDWNNYDRLYKCNKVKTSYACILNAVSYQESADRFKILLLSRFKLTKHPYRNYASTKTG